LASPVPVAPIIDYTLSPRLKQHLRFHSRFLPDDRDLSVYLPPGYDDSRQYPVLYLHDGQNLFDPHTSFIPGRTWQVAETADAAIEAGEVEPLLIVGIANTGERRMSEYTPTRDWNLGGGEGAKYGQLITHDLMPFIAARYPVRPGPASTGLGGSSLGGLITLYLGLEYPQYFGRLAVLSPSLWWNHKAMLGYVNQTNPGLGPRPRIWLDVGDGEGRQTLSDANLLARRLEAKGWRAGKDLEYRRIVGGCHDEVSWAKRVRPMLRFLFPA
jgi:predicted alpha/beta superfamily hydrolase